MIRVVVNRDLCGAHGMCEREAPEVFRVIETDDGYAGVELLKDTIADDPLGHVRSAVNQCPNQAIEIVEE
jgi:ferredoxin